MTYQPAEMSVLAACLLDGAALDRVKATLSPRDFEAPATRVVYQAMCAMREAGMPIDVVTLGAQLQGRGDLEVAGGNYGLSEILANAGTAANVEHHARIIHQRAGQRHARAAAAAYVAGERGTTETREALERLEKDAQRGERPAAHVSKGLDRLFTQGAQPSLPLGLTDLHDLDVNPCHLVVVGARPSSGKTAMLGTIALAAAGSGWDVLFLSLEMPSLEIQQRLLAGHSGIPLGDVKRADNPKMIQAAAKLSELSIWVEDGHEEPRLALDMEGISALVKTWAASGEARPKVVLVDYLQFIHTQRRFERRNLEVGHLCRELKRLASTTQVAMVVAAQVGRGVEQRGKEARPQMADLAESSDIEKNADKILLLHRDFGTEAAAIKVAKNRQGAVGTVEATFNGPLCLFQDRGSWQ